ncbi:MULTISPECIES: hypothetical protein, partial [Bifidobacterium]|uniref:hypothetical protein n=1 Tax=Bifidobacterium TaxID=1678 RepID=UPI001E5B76F2
SSRPGPSAGARASAGRDLTPQISILIRFISIILIAYYRWHMTEFSSAVGWLLIALGTLIFGAVSISL